jgi:glutathione S-transferase
MAEHLYIAETPDEVKNAKGLHLITQSTPNGQKVQILLEELAETYGTQWTTTIINISTNEQKKEWFLRLNPNGRIPVLVDNSESPPFLVMETSAELLYLLKVADKDDKFGFKDDLERSECLQWLFFCRLFRLSQKRIRVARMYKSRQISLVFIDLETLPTDKDTSSVDDAESPQATLTKATTALQSLANMEK